ncbi:archease domain containing protein [Babesia gibsoni]|uniref:Archease domain containing protein n=1 Tax=Babesia gibsoni TaxID=33632 RepID=A0AAD8UVZ7_BABGI|nr:archease domain containing protein [Babesia gibsoni]
MEDENKYVLDGIDITSRPPRGRHRDDKIKDVVALPVVKGDAFPLEPNDDSTEQELEALRTVQYEYSYLDHPADVVITGTGGSLGAALESIAIGMYGYMTDLSLVEPSRSKRLELEANTLPNLLFHFMDECLYIYSSEYFIARYIRINEELDIRRFLEGGDPVKVSFLLYGDTFDPGVHTSGTEIKAITYHELKIEVTMGEHVTVLSHGNGDDSGYNDLRKLLESQDANALGKCTFKLFMLVDI